VQVDPIKPVLKALGTKRLKPKFDLMPSTSAFKFNLRRYNVAHRVGVRDLRVSGAYTSPLFSST